MSESVGLVLAFGAGVLSFLSPCVLPLVPSYLSFITGISLENLQEGVNRKAALRHAALFIAGFSAIFLVLGASASFLGQLFRSYEAWIARIGGMVIVILGLHLTGVLRLTPLLRERRIHLRDKPVGYVGTMGVGAAFGAGWTPCIGPVLGAILTFASTREQFWQGVGLLAAYSAGLALPFLLTALGLNAFLGAFARFRRFLPTLQVASGVLVIVFGLLLLSGTFTILSAYLIRLTPDFILERI
ncbi:MAG: cytochrome c biogenesis protein CcdA [Gemmatimonadetes bacterium]|nr:cytochrome c biogenesis protein CcdA [Gemmatimonadota bacterium]